MLAIVLIFRAGITHPLLRLNAALRSLTKLASLIITARVLYADANTLGNTVDVIVVPVQERRLSCKPISHDLPKYQKGFSRDSHGAYQM